MLKTQTSSFVHIQTYASASMKQQNSSGRRKGNTKYNTTSRVCVCVVHVVIKLFKIQNGFYKFCFSLCMNVFFGFLPLTTFTKKPK